MAVGPVVTVHVESLEAALRLAGRLVALGVPVEADGTDLTVYEEHLPLLDHVRVTQPAVRNEWATALQRTCPACSGALGENGVCTSCYWSANPADQPPDVNPRRLDRQLDFGIRIDRCVVIGGSNVPLLVGADVSLHFTTEGTEVLSEEGDLTLHKLGWADMHGLWVGGAGEVTTDAGMLGGGTGVKGAAAGMLLAWAVNRVTRQTTVSTMIGLTLAEGELILLHGRYGPQSLRLMLSPAFTKVGTHDPALPGADGRYARRGQGIIFVNPE